MNLNLVKEPVPHKQPCQKSCVATCIAMATGRDPLDIIDHMERMGLQPRNGLCSRDITYYMTKCGIHVHELGSLSYGTLPTGMYLAETPSLNYAHAATHLVLVQVMNMYVRVFDPQRGNEGMKYYDSFDDLVATNWYILDDFSDMRVR